MAEKKYNEKERQKYIDSQSRAGSHWIKKDGKTVPQQKGGGGGKKK